MPDTPQHIQTTQKTKHLSGWVVFAAFAAFFALIILVNGIFIYSAIETHPGVIAEDSYKKGLAYNEVLQRARHQPDVQSRIDYENGAVHLRLRDAQGHAIEGAQVSARFIRPVQDGYDFSAPLQETAQGLYEVKPQFPLHGDWNVRLSATWNDQTYQASKDIVVK